MSLSRTDNPSDRELSDGQVRPMLLTLLCGGIVVSFSNSALNPAIPVFMAEFDVDIVVAGWILNAYLLAMSIGLIVSSYLQKRFAFKPVYTAAMAAFILGSVLGMQASSMPIVIAARAMQGLGGGLIIPLSIGMLYQIYPQQRHGRAMALWGIVIMMSLSFGPLVGAFLVEQFAWWTLFFVTLPLSIGVLVMVCLYMPDMTSPETGRAFDTLGFASLLAWLLLLMTWLSTLTTAASLSTNANLLIAIGFLLAAVAWWTYERRHSQPILNVALFRNKPYLHSNIISVTQTLGLMICLLLVPVVIQDLMAKSAIWTGVALLIATLVASITTHYAGKRVDQRGARDIGMWGIVISSLSTLMLAWCLYKPSLWLLISVLSLRGVGVGLSYLPTTTVGFSSLPKDVVTEGAALNNISRRIASTLFIALVTLYIQGRTTQLLTVAANEGATQAIQEVFVFIAVMLLFTLPSAAKLPQPDK